MATVLISFIGKGEAPVPGQMSRGGYAEVTYFFPASSGAAVWTDTSSMFGLSLLKWLRAGGIGVDRWLVLGTPQSLWPALHYAVPPESHYLTEDAWCATDDAVKDGYLDDVSLDVWEQALKPVLGVEPVLRIVGRGEDEESQQRLWNALSSSLGRGDRVILDITHAFRSLPVLGAFMLVLLRWLKGIADVDLWYGAYDPHRPSEPHPAIHLTLCGELFRMAEAASIRRHTGSYRELGECLDLPPNVLGELRKLAFLDEITHSDPAAAGLLAQRLDQVEAIRHPCRQALAAELQGELSLLADPDLAKRLMRRAAFECEKRQYFQSIALLYEAMLVAACNWYGYPVTESASRELARDRLFDELKNGGRTGELSALWDLRHVRNNVLHGTEPGKGSQAARDALTDESAFRKVFSAAQSVLKSLHASGGPQP